MTSFFYRATQRSFPTVVAAATSATVAAVSFSKRDRRNRNDGSRGPAFYDADGVRRGVRPSGTLLGNQPYGPPLHSTAFSTLMGRSALCEAPPPPQRQESSQPNAPYKPSDPAEPTADPGSATTGDGKKSQAKGGMWVEGGDELYRGLFPKRQLWKPPLEYPLWDKDWDQRRPPPIVQAEPNEGEKDNSKQMTEAQRERYIRKKGVTRHIILIRHGQYDETHKEDAKRLLTPLGRKQAELTGNRLGELIRGVNENFGPCRVKVVHVSNLARAKETADIIYGNMGLDNFEGEAIERADPDPLLNEGRPCHHIPGGKARQSVVERTDEHHPRIEQAFRKYFYRADFPDFSSLDEEKGGSTSQDDVRICCYPVDVLNHKAENKIVATSSDESNPKLPPLPTDDGAIQQKLRPHPQHEFEIIVCHANVIRYFFCRALQLPPEAWLRLCTFNCSLTYFTIRPTGTVSCRMLGDIGHLPYDLNTFSMHTGFNW